MSAKYGEPWRVLSAGESVTMPGITGTPSIVDCDGLAVVCGVGVLRIADARRIVSCVNAMAGKEVDVPIAKGERDAGFDKEEQGVGVDR